MGSAGKRRTGIDRGDPKCDFVRQRDVLCRGRFERRRRNLQRAALVEADPGGGLERVAGLSCPSVGVCFAIDAESSEVFRYGHGRWSVSADLNISTPQGGSEPNSLEAISCGSRNFCVVLDGFGEAFTYDGKWSSSPQNFDDIEDEGAELSCTASLTCVAVDDSDDVVVDQAGAWSAPRHLGRSSATLNDVSCAPRSRCVVIDDKGGFFVGHPAR
jgi:hypothetical protein